MRSLWRLRELCDRMSKTKSEVQIQGGLTSNNALSMETQESLILPWSLHETSPHLLQVSSPGGGILTNSQTAWHFLLTLAKFLTHPGSRQQRNHPRVQESLPPFIQNTHTIPGFLLSASHTHVRSECPILDFWTRSLPCSGAHPILPHPMSWAFLFPGTGWDAARRQGLLETTEPQFLVGL